MMKKRDLFKSVVSKEQRAKSKVLPKGFWTSGVASGVKGGQKKDLALFYSQVPTKVSAVFTSNQVQAAPVMVSKEHLTVNARPDQVGGKRKTENGIQAIIANSGCANACTGERGIKDAKEMCVLTAKLFRIKPEQVLVASTGVIGRYLPIEKIRQGIKKLVAQFTFTPLEVAHRATILLTGQAHHPSPISAVEAIMTTDTFPKIVSKKIFLPSLNPNPYPLTPASIWSCAKGAGMIHPDLATLLCFILTDLAIDEQLLKKALKTAVDQSFNCITVDGETSTNDTVLILANGLAGNQPIKKEDKNFYQFQNVLNEVTLSLAKMVTKDGEGATKLVKIVVKNAKNTAEAMKIARAIAVSPLVKTAFFGADPNWGRIMGAIGHSGVKIKPEKIDLYFDNLLVAKNGAVLKSSGGLYARRFQNRARRILQKKEFTITVNLNQGKGSAGVYTCDLSTEYVKINSAYST